jgi:hypothetical protein
LKDKILYKELIDKINNMLANKTKEDLDLLIKKFAKETPKEKREEFLKKILSPA